MPKRHPDATRLQRAPFLGRWGWGPNISGTAPQKTNTNQASGRAFRSESGNELSEAALRSARMEKRHGLKGRLGESHPRKTEGGG